MSEAILEFQIGAERSPRVDLQELAGYAAIELESAFHDKKIGYKAVKEFTKSINDQTQSVGTSAPRRSLFDPVTEVAMFRAVRDSEVTDKPEATSDFFNIAAKIAKSLDRIVAGEEKQAIRKHKEFFLGFARHLSALEQPLADARPSHPDKR